MLIRGQLQAVPTMPATVIAYRVGWDRGFTVFKARVAELRPVYLPPDPVGRTTYEAGELAQFDFWFPAIELPSTRPAPPRACPPVRLLAPTSPPTTVAPARLMPTKLGPPQTMTWCPSSRRGQGCGP